MIPNDGRARVMLVVNKWWELDPVMGVLLHAQARPPALGWPETLEHPRPRPADRPLPPGHPHVRPRATWALRNVRVEVWCVSDLLEFWPDFGPYQSSSQRKVEMMPRIFAGKAASLVIAAGTAAWPDPDAEPGRNGCVALGRRCFLHDGHPGGTNPDSRWTDAPFDTIVDSSLSPADFSAVLPADADRAAVLKRFVRPPNRPVDPQIVADEANVSLGTVNVTDYREYNTADRATLDAWAAKGDGSPAVSVETTHGIIRLAAGKAPFLFASGLPNRVLHFADEVSSAEYAQNFAAAHNLGVVLAWMLPRIDAHLG